MVRRKRVNTKRNAKAIIPTPLAALLSVVVAVALVYLWLCSRCEGLAVEIQRLERQNAELQRRVNNEQFKWVNLHSLKEVRAALDRHQIVMDWPEGRRVIHLAAAPADGPRPPSQSSAQAGQWAVNGRTRPHE